MKKVLWLVAVGAVSLAGMGAFGIAGCTAQTDTSNRPSVDQLAEGLTVLEAVPAWGLNAAYRKGTNVVYLESRVGSQKPEVYRQAFPDEPPYEMDLRFVNKEGRTFYVQRGGDDFVDPDWQADIAKHARLTLTTTPADIDADWELAKEGALSAAAILPPDMKDDARHFSTFGLRPTPAQDPLLKAKAARIAQQPRPPEMDIDRGYSNFNFSGWSWFETDLASKWVVWLVAHHTATRMWDCEWNGTSCSWVLVQDACNHGTCYANMGYECYSNGGWFYNATINGETSSSTSISGGCQTPYNWNSGGYNHLCNDDSAYELWQAKNGSKGGPNYGTSGDGTHFQYYDGHHFACDCGSFSGCDGDWSVPSCP